MMTMMTGMGTGMSLMSSTTTTAIIRLLEPQAGGILVNPDGTFMPWTGGGGTG